MAGFSVKRAENLSSMYVEKISPMDRTRSYKTRTSTHVKLKVIALAYGNEVAVGFQCRALLSPSSLICRRPSMTKVEHFMNSILFRAPDDGHCPDGLFFDEDILRKIGKPTKGLHGKLTESPSFPVCLRFDRSLALTTPWKPDPFIHLTTTSDASAII